MLTNINETTSNEVVVGQIPPAVLDAARVHFNLPPDEIWGIYLTPNDPRNPQPGEHYLGKSKKTPEQMSAIITKEESALDKDNELQSLWARKMEQLNLLPKIELAELVENGIQIIEIHERKHKEQWERTSYQSVILQASKSMQKFEESDKGDIEAQRKAIRCGYQDLVLIAETQALATQTSTSLPYVKEFSQFWFAKTFELFNISVEEKILPGRVSFDPSKENPLDIEYVKKPVPILETLFIELRNGSEFNSKVSNVYGLLSRALYLCENPAEVLKGIRANQLDCGEFTSLILSGLEKMNNQSAKDLIIRAKGVSTNLDDELLKKSRELEKLIYT